MSSVNFIFLHGRGGSGKDTQAELLTEKFPEAIRLSTGDIYRGARSQTGEFGQFYPLVAPHIEDVDSGHFLPDTVILQMVDEVVAQKTEQGIDKFIFTGFPRTNEQLDAIDEWTFSLSGANKEVKVDNIYYVVLEQHARARSEKRRREYGEQKIQVRADDEPDAVENKLKNFNELTLPMLKRLNTEKRLKVIRANGSIEQVFGMTLESLGYHNQLNEGNGNVFERR